MGAICSNALAGIQTYYTVLLCDTEADTNQSITIESRIDISSTNFTIVHGRKILLAVRRQCETLTADKAWSKHGQLCARNTMSTTRCEQLQVYGILKCITVNISDTQIQEEGETIKTFDQPVKEKHVKYSGFNGHCSECQTP